MLWDYARYAKNGVQHPRGTDIAFISGKTTQAVTTTVDHQSYLQPLMESLRQLACEGHQGEMWDGSLYTLRAHVITISGDMPAIAKVRLPVCFFYQAYPNRISTYEVQGTQRDLPVSLLQDRGNSIPGAFRPCHILRSPFTQRSQTPRLSPTALSK